MAGGGAQVGVEQLSIRELQALGALCLAAFCGHFAIVHRSVDDLTTHQVSLLSALRLPDWEQAGAGLRLAGRGDPIHEEVLSVVPAEWREDFGKLVECTVEIGIANLYGACSEYPQKHLLQAMEVLKARTVSVPDAELVKVQPRPLSSAWGEPVPQEVCRPIFERCQALLRGTRRR